MDKFLLYISMRKQYDYKIVSKTYKMNIHSTEEERINGFEKLIKSYMRDHWICIGSMIRFSDNAKSKITYQREMVKGD